MESPLVFKAAETSGHQVAPIGENALLAAIRRSSKRARRPYASFEICQYCGHRTAPEWLHDSNVCESCAHQHSAPSTEPLTRAAVTRLT